MEERPAKRDLRLELRSIYLKPQTKQDIKDRGWRMEERPAKRDLRQDLESFCLKPQTK
jgi:hypothetical protein